ncbi:MAG: hypothetical protein HZB91_10665 [Elusimicrobia bacterium]|nr:hypothetical protein [Elusimicrobiota bacterium]
MSAAILASLFFLSGCSSQERDRADFTDAVRLVQREWPVLARGLRKQQPVITMPELETISRLAKHGQVKELLYTNGSGEVRWYYLPSSVSMVTDLGPKKEILLTAAVESAVMTRAPAYERTDSGAIEVAVPIVMKRKLLGIVIFKYVPTRLIGSIARR